jgi:hypothetical protein
MVATALFAAEEAATVPCGVGVAALYGACVVVVCAVAAAAEVADGWEHSVPMG